VSLKWIVRRSQRNDVSLKWIVRRSQRNDVSLKWIVRRFPRNVVSLKGITAFTKERCVPEGDNGVPKGTMCPRRDGEDTKKEGDRKHSITLYE